MQTYEQAKIAQLEEKLNAKDTQSILTQEQVRYLAATSVLVRYVKGVPFPKRVIDAAEEVIGSTLETYQDKQQYGRFVMQALTDGLEIDPLTEEEMG